MLARVDAEPDYGFLAKRPRSLQPVQALDQDKARAIGPYRIGDCWPLSSMLAAMSSTRFCSSVARRFTGT